MSNIRIAGIVPESVVDGPGIRYTIFTQGCPHVCEGCHNPDTHDFDSGYTVSADEIMSEIKKNPLISGLTLSGGEPFVQAAELVGLCVSARDNGYNIIVYTGYTFEELLNGADDTNNWKQLLLLIDILVDGRFELSQKSLSLRFKGSKNQRVIDVAESLEKGEVIETDF